MRVEGANQGWRTRAPFSNPASTPASAIPAQEEKEKENKKPYMTGKEKTSYKIEIPIKNSISVAWQMLRHQNWCDKLAALAERRNRPDAKLMSHPLSATCNSFRPNPATLQFRSLDGWGSCTADAKTWLTHASLFKKTCWRPRARCLRPPLSNGSLAHATCPCPSVWRYPLAGRTRSWGRRRRRWREYRPSRSRPRHDVRGLCLWNSPARPRESGTRHRKWRPSSCRMARPRSVRLPAAPCIWGSPPRPGTGFPPPG